MQAWIIPGTPLTDGWHLWYATDGTHPQPPQVWHDGTAVQVDWQVSPAVQLQGFDRSIFRVRLRLPDAQPQGQTYRVKIPETGEQHDWSTLPASLPPEGLSLLFSSCFWQQDDAEGALLQALKDVLKAEQPRPILKLLLGDQIYLDWPADVAPWRLRRGGYRLVGERYQRYWGDDAYRQFLSLLPNLVVPDDHEFWNDYPESQIQLPITWRSGLREDFAAAANDYYRAFQGFLNPSGWQEAWTIIPMHPASLFVADTRSERSHIGDNPHRFMSEAQWNALEDWQYRLTGPGLLALGQPLFQRDGDWRDHSLSNFAGEYRRLLALLQRSASGDNQQGTPHNIVMLSGDIHNARSTYATIPGIDDPDFKHVHELVASASSAIGPHVITPSPAKLPSYLPPGDADPDFQPRWPVRQVEGTVPFQPARPEAPYACVDNNLGIVQLRPNPVSPYSVQLLHRSYRIRPFRKPYLRTRRGGSDSKPTAGRLIYTQTLNLR